MTALNYFAILCTDFIGQDENTRLTILTSSFLDRVPTNLHFYYNDVNLQDQFIPTDTLVDAQTYNVCTFYITT